MNLVFLHAFQFCCIDLYAFDGAGFKIMRYARAKIRAMKGIANENLLFKKFI